MFIQERKHRQPTGVWGHGSDADGVNEWCDSWRSNAEQSCHLGAHKAEKEGESYRHRQQ